MTKNCNVLSFDTPPQGTSDRWCEGLFVGNGHVGANVFGGAAEEHVLINDVAVNHLGRTTVVPDVSENVQRIVDLVHEGEYMRAQRVLPEALAARNFRPQADQPLPLAEIILRLKHNGATTEYCRKLDMERGVATVRYKANGTEFVRDLFVSRAENVVVYRLGKHGNGTISCQVGIGAVANTDATNGVCGGMPSDEEVVFDKPFVCFAAHNDDKNVDYGVVARVSTLGGNMRVDGDKLVVNNAQSVLIVLQTFVGARQKQWADKKIQLSSMRDGYEKMLKSHVQLHSKLYNSASIRLSNDDDVAADVLLKQAERDILPPMLAEKMYKLARYLFVSATSDDGNPIFPTGLWNGSYFNPLSVVTYDGQMQASYLFSLCGNMYGNIDKLFDLFERYVCDYQNNAQRIFSCRGVVVPVVQAPDTGRLGTTDVFGMHFAGCAAWICSLFYKYAKFSNNTKFLKSRLVPFMKQVALFYLDFMRDEQDGVQAIPSPLPMRIGDNIAFADRPIVAKNSVLDFELCRDLLTNLIEACNTLNLKVDRRWRDLVDKLPCAQIGSDGAMREFVNSIISVDYTGISNGTLYQAYFGEDCNILCDKQIVDKYLVTANVKRTNPSAQNSYNTSVLGAVYARLGDGDKALQCLGDVVRGCALSNLAIADQDWRGMGVCGNSRHRSLVLQSNFMFANVVQQMLLYAHEDKIVLLPALPADWHYVEFRDLVCDNGVVVALKYDGAKGVFKLNLLSKKANSVHLYLPSFVKKLTKCTIEEKPKGNDFVLDLPSGKAVELTYKVPTIKPSK